MHWFFIAWMTLSHVTGMLMVFSLFAFDRGPVLVKWFTALFWPIVIPIRMIWGLIVNP